MKLTKIIPAHRRTVNFNWCKRDFMPMTPGYRQMRSGSRAPMDKCDWCNHAFVDNELMGLAQPTKGRNWILCQDCCEELLASKEPANAEA